MEMFQEAEGRMTNTAQSLQCSESGLPGDVQSSAVVYTSHPSVPYSAWARPHVHAVAVRCHPPLASLVG